MKNRKLAVIFSMVVIFGAVGLLFTSTKAKIAGAEKIENFSLKDYNGKTHSLSDYKNSKAVVLIFVSTQCPVSNGYNERMEKLKEQYAAKNVAVLGINANKEEKPSDIKAHAEKNKLSFPILKDEGNKLADKLKASVTPEVYIVNPDMEVLYHGRIDDSRDGSSITSRDAAAALDEILAGKKVTTSTTKAFGCSIKRVNS